MREYGRLSDHDFERLVGDLLGAELGVRFEAFARGRDQGIDLRYLSPESTGPKRLGKGLIVQCKHYTKSGYAKLRWNLENSELPKIRKLDPDRLILVTSVDLTPANKQELLDLMSGTIKTESDIIGISEVEGLLNRHSAVEREHYKLWLTSTAVLGRVLHGDIYANSCHVLHNVERNAIRYVQNASFPRARQILSDAHVCVISGPPGIGKTTLAQMLLLEYVADGYEPIIVSQDVDEANSLWSPDPSHRQLFFYDDFLGQAGQSDKLNKNEDARLQYLLGRIAETKDTYNRRLILTTREYILQQAQAKYEKLTRANLDIHKHVIRLEDYTRLNRAHILYNHIFFSDLPIDAKASFANAGHYTKIISHANYTPRVIDDIARRASIAHIDPSEVPQFFLATLDDPEALWRHAFDEGITSEARLLLSVLSCLPLVVQMQSLRIAFDSAASVDSRRFNAVIKEIDGDFLRTDRSDDVLIVAFSNPSVRDFVLKRVFTNEALTHHLLRRAVFFDQVRLVAAQSASEFSSVSLDVRLIVDAMVRTFESEECRVAPHRNHPEGKELWRMNCAASRLLLLLELLDEHPDQKEHNAWLFAVAESLGKYWREEGFISLSDMIEIARLLMKRDPDAGMRMTAAIKAGIDLEYMGIDDAELISSFNEYFPGIYTEEECENICAVFTEQAEAEIGRMLKLSNTEELEAEAAHIRTIGEYFGYSISEFDEQRIVDRIADLASIENDYYESWIPSARNEVPASISRLLSHEPTEDELIHRLFDTLKSG